MKRILLLCLSFIVIVNAKPYIKTTESRIEPGQTIHLQLFIPLNELPQKRSTPQLKTRNDFKLLKLDSAKKTMPLLAYTEELRLGRGVTLDSALIYTFEVKAPQKTGQLDLGSLSWKANGKQSTISNEYQITVSRPYNAPALEATATPSKKSVYIGEQFGISYNLLIYPNNRGGILHPDSVDFGNNFTFFRNDHPKIESKPNEKSDENLITIPFAWWLIPNKNGTLEIPSIKFQYTKQGEPRTVEEKIQEGNKSRTFRKTTYDTVNQETFTPPISITVLPLPTKGKPADFSGMVGSYKFSASFNQTKLKMGDTLTLAINISGDGAIEEIANPKIPDLSDFSWELPETKVNKKIEDTKVISTKDIKMALFPRRTGTIKIPAITYSWFNPGKKKYEKASAGPWTIEVE